MSLNLKLNLADLQTGGHLVYNSPLGNVFRAIINNGLKSLAQSGRMSELSWMATVREYNPSTGAVYFDSGLNERISPKETFAVYAVSPTTGVCNVYKVVAYISTAQVDAVSSVAFVTKQTDSRGVREGDIVMIAPQ